MKPINMNEDTSSAREWNEPLADLAQAAWDLAPKHCRPEHGCLDYHRAWSLVRLVLNEGLPPAGETFFRRELGRIVQLGGRRILVSGGADSGLSAIVLRACRAAGVEPEMIFADRCATACKINAHFAQSVGANMKIVEGDVRELDIEPVDAVVAHSFLQFFEGDNRQQVINTWHRNLRDGGEVLISNVLKASEVDWMTSKSTDALRDQKQKLLNSAVRFGHPTAATQELVEVVERFWRISPARPPGLTESNLISSLKHAGFQDVLIHYSDVGVNDGPIAMVRHKLEGKARAEILAVKTRIFK